MLLESNSFFEFIIYTKPTDNNAPQKPNKGKNTQDNFVIPKAKPIEAPNAAPPEIPNVKGSANGFLSTP